MKKHCSYLLTLILVGALGIGTFLYLTQKQDIRTASIKEIEVVYDIGPALAAQIKNYAVTNNIESVDQLDIEQIGSVRMKALKKKFK